MWVIVNIMVTLALAAFIKSPLIRFYLAVNFVYFINPGIMAFLFGVSHPLHNLDNDVYDKALIFVAIFNIIMCGSFVFFRNYLPKNSWINKNIVGHRINYTDDASAIVATSFLFFIVAIFAKFALDGMSAFRMNDAFEDTGSSTLQLLKTLSSFDVLILIFLGEVRMTRRNKDSSIEILFLILFIGAIVVALITGSRAQVITVIIAACIAFRDIIMRNKTISAALAALIIPSVFLIFPVLASYRSSNYEIDSYVVESSIAGRTKGEIALDVLTTRMNYMETVAHAIDYVGVHGPTGGEIYWNNIVGIVPRAIWPGKPIISNDSQILGHMLGIVTENDSSTSIGLTIIGEAFFELGWMGLAMAVAQGLLFAAVDKNFLRPGNRFALTIYIFTMIYLITRDGYFAVIPGLIWTAIGFFIIFGFMAMTIKRRQRQHPRALTTEQATPGSGP